MGWATQKPGFGQAETLGDGPFDENAAEFRAPGTLAGAGGDLRHLSRHRTFGVHRPNRSAASGRHSAHPSEGSQPSGQRNRPRLRRIDERQKKWAGFFWKKYKQ